MAKKGIVGSLLSSSVPVDSFSDQVQSLQKQIAQLPELIRERDLLMQEIVDRQKKVDDGLLTERALDKPSQELAVINQTINMARNDWPQQIFNNLTGELREELQHLRFKTRAARKIADQSQQDLQDAKERLNTLQARRNQVDSTGWSSQEQKQWDRDLEAAKRDLARASNLYEEMAVPLRSAESELAEFKQFCITGLR